MKLLVIGASGVLGSRLYNDAIKKKWNVLGTYCSHEIEGLFYLDLRDRKSIEKMFNFFEPEAVVLAGGITDVDLCELKPKLARDVNIKGTLNLAKKIREFGSKLVYISTDYVFDGEDGPYDENARPNPVNIYGRTKLEAENIAKSYSRENLVIRTSQLYGPDYFKRNFVIKIICGMRDNKKIYAADDLYGTPTYAGALSFGIVRLLEKDIKGVFNIAGADFLSRYEYVNKISEVFKLDKNLVKRVKLEDLKLKARRPKAAGLETTKARAFLKDALFSCSQGLRILKKEQASL